jgi:4-amino-4-deoxy-L-arabinose transferase-like glycosyltransferase
LNLESITGSASYRTGFASTHIDVRLLKKILLIRAWLAYPLYRSKVLRAQVVAKPDSWSALNRLRESLRRFAITGTSTALAAIAVLGLALRLFRIGDASLWSDELFSVLWVPNSFGFLWGPGLEIETTPALYYTLLKPWLAVFGSGDVAARSLSAVLSAATILLVFVLARHFGGRAAGLLAAGLFAVMPVQIHYAQEARAYALLPLLYTVATLGVVWFIKRSAGQDAAPARQAGPLALYGLAALLLVYSHATSAFTLAMLGLACLIGLLHTRSGWLAILRFAAVNALVVVLAIPEIKAILAQSNRFDMRWVLPPDRISLLNAFGVLLVDPSTPLTAFRLSCILAGAVTAMLLVLLLRARLGRMAWLLLIGVPLAFLGSTILVSFASPFFIPRIAIWVGVPFCIVAALALEAPQPRWARLAFFGTILLAWGVGLHGVYARSITAKEDWRGLAAEVAVHFQARDLVVIGPGTNLRGFAWYIGPNLRQTRWRPAPAPDHPLLFLPAGVPKPEPITTTALIAEVRRGRPVWLVLKKQDWETYGAELTAAVPARLPPPLINQEHAMLTLLYWPATDWP